MECNNCIDTKHSPIKTFYDYFTVRCPEEGFHEYGGAGAGANASKCRKCAFDAGTLESLNKPYYAKYKDAYTARKGKDRGRRRLVASGPHKAWAPSPSTKWEPTNVAINKLIKKYNISAHLMFNLGAIEKSTYNVASSTVLYEGLNSAQTIKRNGHLYGYYLYIVRSYYTLKNRKYLYKLPEYIDTFLSTVVGRALNSMNGKAADLPDVDVVVTNDIAAAATTPSNYLLHHICSILLAIRDVVPQPKVAAGSDKGPGHAFVAMLLDNILQYDKQLTEYVVMNYLVNRKQNNVQATVAAVDGEAGAPMDVAGDDEADADPFSLGDIDLDLEDDAADDGLYKDVADRD
jgi:hypothetical protein